MTECSANATENCSIYGGAGDDFWILGGEGKDTIDGGAGADIIAGGPDDDTIAGGDGDDEIAGDGGTDTIDGGRDEDVIWSGSGAPSGLQEMLDGGPQCDIIDGVPECTPNVQIQGAAAPESNGTMSFLVTLSEQQPVAVTVDWETVAGGMAEPGMDYVVASGTVTFDPGEMEAYIPVTIVNDVYDEFDEDFEVYLSNPTNAAIEIGSASGTITDDDPPPVATVADVTASEGNDAVFTVTLSAASGKIVTVDYS